MVDGALLLTAIYVSLFLYVKAYPRQAFAEFLYWWIDEHPIKAVIGYMFVIPALCGFFVG